MLRRGKRPTPIDREQASNVEINIHRKRLMMRVAELLMGDTFSPE
jgi:hypothetical protein